MTVEELEQMIELHDAYDKHVPAKDSELFGAFASSTSFCKTCGTILHIFSDGTSKTLSVVPAMDIIRTATYNPAIFKMFVANAKRLECLQSFSDMVIDMARLSPAGIQDAGAWRTLAQLGIPSEGMLRRTVDKRSDIAMAAAKVFPTLRDRCYKSMLRSRDIQEMFNYTQLIIGRPDKAMLDAAEKIQRASGTLSDNGSDYEDFAAWHYKMTAVLNKKAKL